MPFVNCLRVGSIQQLSGLSIVSYVLEECYVVVDYEHDARYLLLD